MAVTNEELVDEIYSELDRAKAKLLELYEAQMMTDDEYEERYAQLDRIAELLGQLWETWHPEFKASRYASTKPAT